MLGKTFCYNVIVFYVGNKRCCIKCCIVLYQCSLRENLVEDGFGVHLRQVHLHTGLVEVDSQSKLVTTEDIRVVGLLESFLQLVQLEAVECRPVTSLLPLVHRQRRHCNIRSTVTDNSDTLVFFRQKLSIVSGGFIYANSNDKRCIVIIIDRLYSPY